MSESSRMWRDKIINYRDLIAKSTEDFTGRRWLCQAVEDFLKTDDRRYFLLLGEPGSGKTAFMAHLVQQHGYPHHFIGKGTQIGLASSLAWRNPVRFAESIGYQLLRDYGGWIMSWEDWGIYVEQEVKDLKGLLTGAEIEHFTATGQRKLTVKQEIDRFGPVAQVIGVYIEKFEMQVEQVIHELLIKPLKKITEMLPDRQVVIIVDGLDEAQAYSDPKNNIIKMLPNGSLSTNVRFLLSSRPNAPYLDDLKRQANVVWLSEDENGQKEVNLDLDARAYVAKLVKDPQVQKLLAKQKIAPETLIERVVEASQGNFLYLHHYAEGLRRGDEGLLDLTTLPKGLHGIYEGFVRKIRGGQTIEFWDGAYKPVLGTLAVAKASLTRRQVANLAGIKEGTAGTILSNLGQFRDVTGEGRDRRYAVYHSSFGEYLVSPDNEDYIDAQEAHTRIIDFYLTSFADDWSECDDYGLDTIVHHVVEAEFDDVMLDDMMKQVFTKKYTNARAGRAGWHMPLVRDLQTLKETMPERIVEPCLLIIRGLKPNSLVTQEVLRLLAEIRPKLLAQGKRIVRPKHPLDEVVDATVAALNTPPDDAVSQLKKLLKDTHNVRVRGIIALALGETKSKRAISPLRNALVEVNDHEDHVSWCAADALIALSTSSIVKPLLRYFRAPSVKPGVKNRILYILGRMRAQLPIEETRKLIAEGLELRGSSRGRAIDMTWLLLPKDAEEREAWTRDHEAILAEALGFDSESVERDRSPKWRDEWLQKRLVTALGRIGSVRYVAHLERFAEVVEHRPEPQGRSKDSTQKLQNKRNELKMSIQRAIQDLRRRHTTTS